MHTERLPRPRPKLQNKYKIIFLSVQQFMFFVNKSTIFWHIYIYIYIFQIVLYKKSTGHIFDATLMPATDHRYLSQTSSRSEQQSGQSILSLAQHQSVSSSVSQFLHCSTNTLESLLWEGSSLLTSKRGEMGMSSDPSCELLSCSGGDGRFTPLWAFPMWIFSPFSDLKMFSHYRAGIELLGQLKMI